jgi:hypothetical protein
MDTIYQGNVTNTDAYQSETDSGHKDVEEVPEDRPKPIIFKRYYEPRFIATKVKRIKQFHTRRV